MSQKDFLLGECVGNSFSHALVALELDLVHDTAGPKIGGWIPADGFAAETDIETVRLGFFLASDTCGKD